MHMPYPVTSAVNCWRWEERYQDDLYVGSRVEPTDRFVGPLVPACSFYRLFAAVRLSAWTGNEIFKAFSTILECIRLGRDSVSGCTEIRPNFTARTYARIHILKIQRQSDECCDADALMGS